MDKDASDKSDRATAAEPVVSALRDGIPSAASLDSDDYDHTFYGIINRSGELWTPRWFDSTQDAEAYIADTAKRWGPKFANLPRTHKVVPVRFRIERLPAQAMAARSGETTGSPEGNSAVRQDAPEKDTPDA